ncbi:MAG: helix-turn-helix transcriptional regulator [Candidatus Firestonebacteria bacterium]
MKGKIIEERIYITIGKRIREERKKLGLTQEELAEKISIHPAFLGQIERGTKKASIVTIQCVAKALNITTGKLFAEDTDKLGVKNLSEWQTKISELISNFSANDQKFLYETARALAKKIKNWKKSIKQST